MPSELGRPPSSMPKRSLDIPLLTSFQAFIASQSRDEEQQKKRRKDQENDQRVDRDPDFVQIRRKIILREERSTLKRTVPS